MRRPFRLDPIEHELLQRVEQGDRAAAEELCRREWRPLYRFVAARVSEPAEAEDITQEAFTRAIASLERFRFLGVPFRAYLDQIAHNLVRDRWRKVAARPQVPNEPDRAVAEEDPGELALVAYERQAVMAAFDRLSDEHRRVLYSRVIEGRSAAEVATAFGSTPDAIRAMQYRAVNALRRQLEDPNEDGSAGADHDAREGP